MTRFSTTLLQLLDVFEQESRSDGSKFWRLADGHPEWMTDALRDAHDDELPNDSRYQMIKDCLQSLADSSVESKDEVVENLHLFSPSLVPAYTSDVLAWFSEMPVRLSDCDDELKEGGLKGDSIYEILCAGYRRAAENTIISLIKSLEQVASKFDPNTDCELLLSDSHGIYIPLIWANGIVEEQADNYNVSWDDILICQAGPKAEHYWEAWDNILRSAEWEENGIKWGLYQSDDLWKVRVDVELPDGF